MGGKRERERERERERREEKREREREERERERREERERERPLSGNSMGISNLQFGHQEPHYSISHRGQHFTDQTGPILFCTRLALKGFHFCQNMHLSGSS